MDKNTGNEVAAEATLSHQKTNGSNNQEKPDSLRWKIITAIALILVFAAATLFMAFNVNVEENIWGRYTFLFQGIEAIAFAAVGWIFGKEVNRQRAEKAESSAEKAQKEVVKKEGESKDAEGKLSSLTALIKTLAPKQGTISFSNSILEKLSSKEAEKENELRDFVNANIGSVQNQESDWERLIAFANELSKKE